jgi:hypothetical protein
VVLVTGALVTLVATRERAGVPGEPPVSPPVPSIASPAAAPILSDAAAAEVIPPEPEPPAPPRFVEITIEGAPRGTEVRAAGALVGVLPRPVQLAHGTQPVTLVVEATGYKPTTLQVIPEADQQFIVKLTRSTRPRPGRLPTTDDLIPVDFNR